MNSKANAIRNVLLVGFGGVLGQLVSLLAMPLMTRIYSPVDFGLWALLMGVALVPGTLATLRYEVAIVLPRSNARAVNVVVLCWLLAAATSLTVLVIGIALPNSVYSLVGIETVRSWLWAVPMLVLAKGIYQATVAWHTRMKKFSSVSMCAATLPVVTIITQLTLPSVLDMGGARGLVLGSLVGQVVAASIGLGLIWSNRIWFLRSISARWVCRVFGDYRSCLSCRAPYTLVSELRNRLAIFLFGEFGQTTALGYYVFSERIMRAPVNTMTGAIRPVFFQKAAQNVSGLENSVAQALLFINKAATPMFVLFYFTHSEVFSFVFGEQWRSASVFAAVLSVPMFVLLHVNWLDRVMDVLNRQRLALWLEVTFSLASILALVLARILLESVFWGVVFQSLCLSVYNIVWIIVLYHVARFDKRALATLLKQCVLHGATWAFLFVFLASVGNKGFAVFLYLCLVTTYASYVLRRGIPPIRLVGGVGPARGRPHESATLAERPTIVSRLIRPSFQGAKAVEGLEK